MANQVPTVARQALILAVLSSLWSPAGVCADPIVLNSGSEVRIIVFVAPGDTRETIGSPPPPSGFGTFMFSDTGSVSAGGAASTVTASVATTLTPTQFVSAGGVDAVAVDVAGARGGSNSFAGTQIHFLLTEPHHFSYLGEFFLETDGHPTISFNLQARLDQVSVPGRLGDNIFLERFASPGGLVVPPGTYFRDYSGVLAPGEYVLSGGLSGIIMGAFSSDPGERRARVGYDFAFGLTPVEPVPEPATVALVGTGLLWMARRRRNRSQRR